MGKKAFLILSIMFLSSCATTETVYKVNVNGYANSDLHVKEAHILILKKDKAPNQFLETEISSKIKSALAMNGIVTVGALIDADYALTFNYGIYDEKKTSSLEGVQDMRIASRPVPVVVPGQVWTPTPYPIP